VRLLLDTHALLWAASDPKQLRAEAREALQDETNDVAVSAVTAWEIGIKQSLGKLELPKPAELWLPEVLERTGFDAVSVDLPSALHVRSLPWHHRDPFDRLLIAQAITGNYVIVTRDGQFASYGADILPA